MFLKITVSSLFALLLSGCGLSIYHDWQASGGKAITGGGAVAGKDYINGLLPSADSRKYFSKLAANSDQPIETVSRADDNPSKSGVRFVKNGGILIPPGVTISFTNKGYCMDPHLPAPVANEEYQLVPVTRLIPDDLQGTYKKLVQKASAGDESVKRNMQHLVWALRTAGTDAAYANNLTSEQKRILNRCSEYSGQFEEFNANAKANSQMMKELLAVADSYLNVKIGGVSYKASDLLDPDIGNKKINEHLNQLITMSKSLPVERSGFNYGELQKGIYTDVRGAGVLAYNAKIANTSDKEFIFYPTDYAGQVGSGTKSQGLSFFATANTSQRQRVTGGDPDKVDVADQSKECPPHAWHAVQNGGVHLPVWNDRARKLRADYKDAIMAKKKELDKLLVNDYKKNPNGLERGAIIYYNPETNAIESTEVYEGDDYYNIIENSFLGGRQVVEMIVVRETENGKVYDVYNAEGNVKEPIHSPWGSYENENHEKSFLLKTYYYKEDPIGSSAVNYDLSKVPEGGVPLAFHHLHVTKAGKTVDFSDTDIYMASWGNGIDISVISPYDGGKHYMIDQDIVLDSNGNDISKGLKSWKDAHKNAKVQCSKCGATR